MSSSINPSGQDNSAFGSGGVGIHMSSGPQCEIIAEAGIFGEAYGSARNYTMTDSGTMADSIIVTRASYIIDGLTASESWPYLRMTLMAETGTLTDTFKPVVNALAVMSDAQRLADTIVTQRATSIVDEITGSETYTPARGFVMGESASATDTFSPFVQAIGRIVDALAASDTFTSARASVIAESITGAVAFTFARTAALAEIAHYTEQYVVAGIRTGSMAETATATEAYNPLTSAIQVMAETPCVDDCYVIPGTRTGLTSPTDKFGMSRYDNIMVNSIADFNGQLIGVGDNGVYAFDTTSPWDADIAFNQSITTSIWDGNKAVMKRPGYMYIGLFISAISEYVMELGMIHFQDGPPVEIDINAEPHPQGGYVSVRFKMDRGVRSFYYQFKLNLSNATFKLDDMRGMFDLLSRKV